MKAIPADQLPKDVPEPVRRRYELTLRHKLAMESVGLVRTALNVQRPAFERLLEAEQTIATGVLRNDGDTEWLNHLKADKSFGLQLRFAKECLEFLNKLDALADETIELAAKEKLNA